MTASVSWRRRSGALNVIALAAAMMASAPESATAQSGYYAGKTVRIVVGSSAGGGYDTYARAIAPILAEHLPGKPTVVVQNMPGGGGLTAVLHLDANAPKDGTVISLFNAGAITDMASDPAKAKIDLTKMAWIGSATRSFRMCYFWHGTGIKTWSGLDRGRQVTLGATGAKSASYNDAAILKNLLKQNVRIIAGYPGRTEVQLAVERGEVDGECGTPEVGAGGLVAGQEGQHGAAHVRGEDAGNPGRRAVDRVVREVGGGHAGAATADRGQ